MITLVESRLDTDPNVVEIGGGIGFVSCYLNAYLSHNSEQIVLEPLPDIVEILQENRNRNGCDFHVLNVAYSPEEGQIQMFQKPEFWGASSHKKRTEDTLIGTSIVEGQSLSSVVHEFGLHEFALLMNAEGVEHELIDREMNVLQDRCDILIIGFHEVEGYTREESIQKLTESGFKLLGRAGNEKYAFFNSGMAEVFSP
jgi:FkbM family methyltransferase